MKIHEYQAKQILKSHGVSVLEGRVAETAEQAFAAASELPGPVYVVKSQVHAGGRGNGRFVGRVDPEVLERVVAGEGGLPGLGGVQVVKSAEAAREAAAFMLGGTLVTKQTGRAGSVVNTVYVENGCEIARELYLGVLMDRAVGRIVVMASTEGGTEIEEVAAHSPEKILKVWIDPAIGIGGWQANQIAYGLGLKGKAAKQAAKFVRALYKTYVASDCSMAEINPLVVTADDDVIALDCKMSFDDNALFRHPDIAAMRDEAEEDPAEVEAGRWGLSFVKLDGNIGCMVNGAGLAMATMDIIKFYGSEPANFLDVGGGATAERVAAAFKIITRDPAVKGILVNIFGGIMKCDTIAEGVIAAVKEVGLEVPLVVRLEGTNVELGKRALAESGLPIIAAGDMADAAEKIVNAVKEA